MAIPAATPQIPSSPTPLAFNGVDDASVVSRKIAPMRDIGVNRNFVTSEIVIDEVTAPEVVRQLLESAAPILIRHSPDNLAASGGGVQDTAGIAYRQHTSNAHLTGTDMYADLYKVRAKCGEDHGLLEVAQGNRVFANQFFVWRDVRERHRPVGGSNIAALELWIIQSKSFGDRFLESKAGRVDTAVELAAPN